MKFYLTGGTGNIGRAIIKAYSGNKNDLYIGVRNPEKINNDIIFSGANIVKFDFEDISKSELPSDIDVIFMMRPPQISKAHVFHDLIERLKYIKPFVIFLSIQGADHKEYTPHRKIERLIISSRLEYSFIRPSYFMDNLTTTLLDELKKNKRIYLPSGYCKFNWIDAIDIGALICKVANEKSVFCNSKLEITGAETMDFYETISLINEVCGGGFTYTDPWVVSYVIYLLKEKKPITFILVMLLLHWLPKFGKEPIKTDVFERVMGRTPRKLKMFLDINKEIIGQMNQ